MVVIRLARGGAKKRPFYNIVVADSRKSRDGRYIERVGYFNPVAKGGEVRLLVEEERVNHWTSQGAQPSDRVLGLLRQYRDQTAKGTLGSQDKENKPAKKAKASESKKEKTAENTQSE